MNQTSVRSTLQAPIGPTDLFVCPRCGGDLDENRASGNLSCGGCGTIIRFENGIYVFEAVVSGDYDIKKTISAFGRRWNAVFKRMGALTEFFLPSIQPVRKELFRDKVIVDGGGGFGRLSKLMLDYGARHVVLVDASDGVYAAREYLAPYRDRVTIVRANLLNPPLKVGAFDIFLCHGVLHHTGAPRRVLGNIARALDPARGITILWVYAKEGNRLLARLIATARTACASIGDKGRWMVASVVDFLFWVLTNAVYRPLDRLFGIKGKLYYGEYFMDFLYDSVFNNRVDRLQMYHDFLTTRIVEYYSRNELEAWLRAAGFKKISLHFYRRQSWSVAASFDPDENFSG